MKQTVKIQGLDCPNCARGLEKELNKIDGVKNVEINFVKSALSFESDDCESALTQIVKMTKKLEPDAVIVQKTKKKLNKTAILDIILLALGIGIGVLISVLICQLLESYLLTPTIMSKTMKLHPVTIIIGLLLFGHFFGILGMLFATPIISCGKVIINFFVKKYSLFDE